MSFGIGLGDVLKIYETARDVYRKCRDCPGEYRTLASDARQLTDILQDIADKVGDDKIPESKVPRLLDMYEGCVEVLRDLDGVLNHYDKLDTKSKRAWDRLNWDSQKSKDLRSRLSANVVMLNGFWNSLIHDNQVLILEALARLEKDYAGGHREESRASVERLAANRASVIIEGDIDEEDDEDAAWPQIIRDLEDVGISQHDALEYRDFIIDWFVRAINEGRLMERSVEQHEEDAREGSDSFTRDMSLALPSITSSSRELQKMPSWETPSFPPSNVRRKPIASSPPQITLTPGDTRASPRSSIQHDTTTSTSRPASQQSSSSAPPRRESAVSTPNIGASSQSTSPPEEIYSSLPEAVTSSLPEPVSSLPDLYESYPEPVPLHPVDLYKSKSQENRPRSATAGTLYPGSQPPPGMEYYTALRPVTSVVNLAPRATANTPSSTYTNPIGMSPTNSTVSQPPAYQQDSNLVWTAQKIVTAWNSRDFPTAEKQLEAQITAVEHGETIVVMNQAVQPDKRVLRHLIGICASYSGNFVKAKQAFQSVFHTMYLNGSHQDEGDTAAVRWLGDVCFHLNEPLNAALAWCIALDGLMARYGVVRDMTRRVLEELRMLDFRLQSLKSLGNSYTKLNTDASDIFMNIPGLAKSQLVASISDRLRSIPTVYNYPTSDSLVLRKTYRPRLDMKIAEGFLVQPLLSYSVWPFPFDPSFSTFDAINLYARMTSCIPELDGSSYGHFVYDRIPTVGLGQSKNLDFVTRRDPKWLVTAITDGLKELDIEYSEKANMILCRLNQRRNDFAFFEGIGIKVRKLQFRNVYGIKVTEVLHATRGTPSGGGIAMPLGIEKGTEAFREIVKEILETAESTQRNKEAGVEDWNDQPTWNGPSELPNSYG